MTKQTFTIESLEETQALAKALAQSLRRGDVLCLEGDLGAGKTTFTQFFAQALGVEDYVTSPTFTIMNSYQGVLHGAPVELHHFDVYRIGSPEEMDEIGFDDFLYGDGICVVEWASLVAPLIPKTAVWLCMTFDEAFRRVVTLEGMNERGAVLC